MQHPGFFLRAGPFALSEVARAVGAEIGGNFDSNRVVDDVRPLHAARPNHLTFIDNRKYLPHLSTCAAGACLVAPGFVDRVPDGVVPMVSAGVYRSFALALRLFYPDALRPKAARPGENLLIDPTARIETGAEIEPGAVIGPEAEIGRGSRIAAGAVVGYRCMVGRDCYVGAGASLTSTLLGNRVILHAGVRLGQDGFGFAMGPGGHLKVPQIGRVIVQDDVEIGANTCVDRGALSDTIIGEGTKIDNLVQIGHNVIIGRHCVIVAQVGIAGSARLDDYVVMGGQSGVVGHVRIGQGAQIAGGSHVKDDVQPKEKLIGTPARPIKQWMREAMVLQRLASPAGGKATKASADEDE